MLKKMRRHWFTQVLIWTTVVTTTGSQLIPADAWAGPRVVTPPINWNRGLGPGLQQALSPEVLKKVLERERGRAGEGGSGRPLTTHHSPLTSANLDVRPLTASEMKQIRGRGPYRNKYLQGVLPWHRQLRDVNLCTGNL